MKKFKDVVEFFLKDSGIENLNITGVELLEELELTYDDIYDFASELFYPLDSFTLEISPRVAKMLKTELIIDESMWFKKVSDEYPAHEQNGLKVIFDDCKKVICSSGLTLQSEDYSFVDLFKLMMRLSEGERIVITIPYVIEDFYEIEIEDGEVSRMEVDLSRISRKEGTLALYQTIMFANKHTVKEVLDLID